MSSDQKIILIKGLLGKSSFSRANIYSHGAGRERKKLTIALQAVFPSLKDWVFTWTYDEAIRKIAAKAGHKTANHGLGLFLISTIPLRDVIRSWMRNYQIFFVRAQMTLATEDPCSNQEDHTLNVQCDLQLIIHPLWSGCRGVWQIWAVQIRQPSPFLL